jgi:hypothetical protein
MVAGSMTLLLLILTSVPDRVVHIMALAEPAFKIAANTKRKQKPEIDLILMVALIEDCTRAKSLVK